MIKTTDGFLSYMAINPFIKALTSCVSGMEVAVDVSISNIMHGYTQGWLGKKSLAGRTDRRSGQQAMKTDIKE